MDKALFPKNYPLGFEAFWKAYGPVKNSSKADAFRAWVQIGKFRPDLPELIQAVEAYGKWLQDENGRRAKQRQGEHPKCHPATWLRQRRWEGFIEEAKSMTQATEQKPDHPSDQQMLWDKLAKEIGPEQFRAWFSDAKVVNGAMILPSPFRARWVQEKFSGPVLRAFGRVEFKSANP